MGTGGRLAISLTTCKGEGYLSYKTYRAGVERARAVLQAELTPANFLRHKAWLPTRDIESELERQHPLLLKEAWTARQQKRKGFQGFRLRRLATMVMPTTPAGADWQQVRAVGLRKAYLEHVIKNAWKP